jgi:hypothetical protein
MTINNDDIKEIINKNVIEKIINKLMDKNTLSIIKNDPFVIIKLLTLLCRPNIKSGDAINFIPININIFEAVIVDIVENKDILNTILGINLMILLPKIKDKKILNIQLFKIWCIFYFIWNMKFCKNKNYSTIFSLAHNTPPLIKIFLSLGYDYEELVNIWIRMRESSLLTQFICLLEYI